MPAAGDAIPVITIDGPSGTGKGTVARWLNRSLGWHLLDSGALYRILGLAAETRGIALENESALAHEAAELAVEFLDRPDGTQILLDHSDVTDAIRTEVCGAAASRVAAHPAVRSALLERQKRFRKAPGLVADGRDMGTVVFPNAELKIYLTASVDERAQRRYKQLKEKGISVNLAQLLGDITARDRRDQQRAVSPLKPASDAVILDTTRLDIRAVEDHIKRLVLDRGLAQSIA
jgi:cytidylate kinase